MIKTLYKTFQHWSENGSVYVISDPHFMDYDMNWRINLIDKLEGTNESRLLDLPIAQECIANTIAWYIVKQINKVCHKNDTLIILGDVGNISFVQKLKAGYKVLIKGNHDKGATNYQHEVKIVTKPLILGQTYKEFCRDHSPFEGPGDWYATNQEWMDYCKKCALDKYKDSIADFKRFVKYDYDNSKEFSGETPWSAIFETDNKLFDEVYDGPLFIAKNIVLSHEPIQGISDIAFNIHGHEHYDRSDEWLDYLAGIKVSDCYLNTCCELNAFVPMNLNEIIKDMGLSSRTDIHRLTIDTATRNKLKKETNKDKINE